MSDSNQLSLAKELYRAFTSGDRKFYEEHLYNDFIFSSPFDVGLDKAGYFERCWLSSGQGGKMDFVRLVESESTVTHERSKADGSKGRNTEIIIFKDNKIKRIEAYFGWDIGT